MKTALRIRLEAERLGRSINVCCMGRNFRECIYGVINEFFDECVEEKSVRGILMNRGINNE